MGIKNYSKNLIQEEPSIKNRNYDCILIDCNYLIHYLIYGCLNQSDFDKKVYNYFYYLFDVIDVKNIIYLVFDGKYEKKFKINPKQETIKNRCKYTKPSNNFDKQEIKPKSKIILDFKNSLINILDQLKKINKKKFIVEINDDFIEGEADIKILDIIYSSSYSNFCIISKDTDMVMISYSLILKKNKINIDILFNLRPILFIDINKIIKKYNIFDKDYILLLLLLGNDFLPSVSNINYNILIETYKKYILYDNKKIINKDKINLDNFNIFITYYIIIKNIKYKYKQINNIRFNNYYNNILWTLNYYKIIDYKIDYITDNINNVINIYNFINN
jgi:hypothetical protein